MIIKVQLLFFFRLVDEEINKCFFQGNYKSTKFETSPPINDKKKCAILWTNGSKPDGESIDKQKFNDLVAEKENYAIFIIDNGELENGFVGKVYFNGHLMEKSEESC